ncbi:MAG: ATP F0F1 synthase subunit B [Pseudomonadota bacterium]
MRSIAIIGAVVLAGPAAAASKNPFSLEFYSLANTDFVVSISFVCFVALLWYLGVHRLMFKGLDDRAATIKAELAEARNLREEAQKLLSSYQRKQKEVQEQADRIVAAAKEEAQLAAEQGKADIAKSIERRLAAASEQIAAAEATAVREVRDRAITVAVGAARQLVSKQMTAASANELIDASIAEVEQKLH